MYRASLALGVFLLGTLAPSSGQAPQPKSTKLEGFRGKVVAVAMSADGGRVATMSYVGNPKGINAKKEAEIRIWDAKSGKLLRTIGGLPAGRGPAALALSPDGKTLAGSGTNEVVLWDAEKGEAKGKLKAPQVVLLSSFSADGKALAATGVPFGEVLVWDVEKRTPLLSTRIEFASLGSPSLSADGGRVAMFVLAREGGKIAVWDAKSGKEIRSITLDKKLNAPHVALSPDGKTVVAAHIEGPAIVWDVGTGKAKATYKRGPEELRFLADGKTLVGLVAEKEVRLLNVDTGTERTVLQRQKPDLSRFAISADGKRLITAGGGSEDEHDVFIWELGGGK